MYPLFSSDFNEIWIFSTDFLKIFEYQLSCKYVQWEPSYSVQMGRWMGGQTEIVKLIVAFCNSAELPKGLGCTEIIQIPS